MVDWELASGLLYHIRPLFHRKTGRKRHSCHPPRVGPTALDERTRVGQYIIHNKYKYSICILLYIIQRVPLYNTLHVLFLAPHRIIFLYTGTRSLDLQNSSQPVSSSCVPHPSAWFSHPPRRLRRASEQESHAPELFGRVAHQRRSTAAPGRG